MWGKRKESGTRWPEHWLDWIALPLDCTRAYDQWTVRKGLANTATGLTEFASAFSYEADAASISWKSLTSCNVLCSVVVGLSSLPPVRVGWWHSAPSQLYAALHVIDSSPSPILFFPILSLSCPKLVRGVTNCAVPIVWAHVTKSLSINHWALRSPSLVKRNLF